jgi:cilia- and flagella-associated protein 298
MFVVDRLFDKMVKVIIKKGDENLFLHESTVEIPTDELLVNVVAIYNGRLKVQRICSGMTAWPF